MGEREEARTEEIWLLGQPPMRDYLDFVQDTAIAPSGRAPSQADLIAEWRRANDYYAELEDRELGMADEVECRDLDPALGAAAERVAADPRFRQAFDAVPAHFAMVELGKLMVCQRSVTGTFVDSIAARLGPAPSPAELFRFCLPLDREEAPVRVRRIHSRRYSFESDSTDFRFHEPVLLGPSQLAGYEASGPVASVLGLVVGFGSNFLNGVRVGKRVLLNNGYHRACALYSLGVTHAPCILQSVSRGDELDLVAKSSVARNPDFFFRSARPPLLRDFFDPRIRKVMPIRRQTRVIEVSFEVRDHLVSE